MGKYKSLDSDDMIKIMGEASLGVPCSIKSAEAEEYYKHCLEFAAEVASKGGVVQLPNSMD